MRHHLLLSLSLAWICAAEPEATKEVAAGTAATSDRPAPLADTVRHNPSQDLAHFLDNTRLEGRTLFRLLDTDSDAYLTRQEAEGFLGGWRDGLWTLADRDGDGQLQASELRAAGRDAPGEYEFGTRPESEEAARILAAQAGSGSSSYQAWAYFGQQHAFISDYDVGGSGNYDPVVSVINTGDMIGLSQLVVYQVPRRIRR